MKIADAISKFTERFGDTENGLYSIRSEPFWMASKRDISGDYWVQKICSETSSHFSIGITASIEGIVVYGQYESNDRTIAILEGGNHD